MSRRYDPRRARSHLTYTFTEIARLFEVTIFTARKWRKQGLATIDDRIPYLVSGSELARFIRQKNAPRQPMKPGQIYCVADKAPCEPNRALVRPMTPTSVQLIGHCPRCGHEVHRRVRISELREKAGSLDLNYEDSAVLLGGSGAVPRTALSEGTGA